MTFDWRLLKNSLPLRVARPTSARDRLPGHKRPTALSSGRRLKVSAIVKRGLAAPTLTRIWGMDVIYAAEKRSIAELLEHHVKRT
jgi:hypothetical protein